MISLPTIVGVNKRIRLTAGRVVRGVRLNSAATTPPFTITIRALQECMEEYGALHRGAGPFATRTYERVQESIATIRKFVGADDTHAVLFTENTSKAINLFARLLALTRRDVVMTSAIEHTSNNLPWRNNCAADIVEAEAYDDGALDEEDLEAKAKHNSKRLKLIAVTGASNQTGYIPDFQKLARIADEHGALLFVDAAQLAPHRPINMRVMGIDALAFSAHKVYAPFNLGVLVLPKKLLERAPVDSGGGSIDMISDDGTILWASPEERHQTGTWNVAGIVTLAESCRAILETGWEKIIEHERGLARYVCEELPLVSGLTMYVTAEKYLEENRIGTFPFTLKGYHHALLAAILEHEHGIETRAGTICNHRLVRRWFHVDDVEQRQIEKEIRKGNRLASYGIVRVSLGIHNTKKDIDRLVRALTAIGKEGPQLRYQRVPQQETFEPVL